MFFRAQRAIEDLRDDVAALKRKVTLLESTFDDTLMSLRRTYRNNSRTLARLEEVEGAAPSSEPEEPDTPRLDPISERIMARRRRLAQPVPEVNQ